MPSFHPAEINQITFLTELLQYPVGSGGGQGLPSMKYPDAMFFRKRSCPADWAQGNLFANVLYFQTVAGLQMQFFP